MSGTVARARAEQLRCAALFPDPGAWLGCHDWFAEEFLMEREKMKAPFPWFGGKSRVADLVWERFGNVPNYVEPFFGSGAVLLGRPHAPGTETVNDLDCYLANFWRAVKVNPSTTAAWADWPVNEADLLARHQWLVDKKEFREAVKRDPEYCDFRIAGWWVWGLCQWIGSGWCVQRGEGDQPSQLPHLGDAGRGINHRNCRTWATRGGGSTASFRTWATRGGARLSRHTSKSYQTGFGAFGWLAGSGIGCWAIL